MSIAASVAFLTGPPGPGELILIFLVVLVLFGPKRLPGIARSIGRIMDDLRRAAHDFRDQIMRMDEAPPPRRKEIGDDRARERTGPGVSTPAEPAEPAGPNDACRDEQAEYNQHDLFG